jgi:glycosyltransferase involved in cell wall biosynthesis
METLRVCLLAPDFLPVWGGAGTYAIELSRELARRTDLTVVTLDRPHGHTIVTKAEMESALDHRARIKVIARAVDTFRYNLRFQVAVLRDLPPLVASERFDVIHSQHAHMPDLLYGLVHRTPLVVRTVHSTIEGQREGIRLAESFGGGLEISERWQVALEPVLRAAEWSVLNRPGPLLTVSNWMRAELVRRGAPPERVAVVYNGVRTDRFRPDVAARVPLAPAGDGPTVLYSGRCTLLKGAGVLADAIPLIWKVVPSAHFAFAGGSPAEVRALLAGRDLPLDRVHLLGRLEYEELPGVYAAPDVSVAPTFSDNVPFWVLETLASGVPIVASRVGGIPEVVEDGKNGLLVPPGSAQSLADAVVSLLNDESRRKQIGRAARTSAEEFTWDRTAQATVAWYQAALHEGA